MYYSDDVIEDVRSRSDIVDVISSYVKLKKQGGNYFGLCPFHNEKSPSFSVAPSKQIFHCFGCGEGGNVFSFIMKYDSCSFVEAVQSLAERAGVTLPQADMSDRARAEHSVRTRILEINKLAAKYYYAQLRSARGKLGMDYLTGRNLSKDTMQQFGLGFAVAAGGLYQYLRQNGYDDEIIRKSGLMNMDERRGMTDKFWNRVIFPIMDVNNKVIGFGGRVMGDAKPKYLNSPETEVFNKSRNLYGLNRAKSARTGNIILCEGYMDVITMHQAGFTQAVASLGTALTSGHAALLKRYTENVLLIYDSDEAGVKAALRALPILKGAGISAKVVNLEPYKDPDEFIKALGPDELKKRLDNAENGFFFDLRKGESGYDMSDPDGRTRFIEAAAQKLAAIENEVERVNYISAVASAYMIQQSVLENAVARAAARLEGIAMVPRPRSGLSDNKASREDGNLVAQKLLLTWIVEEPGVFGQVSKYIQPEDYTEGIFRTVAGALYKQLSEGQLNPSAIVSMFEEEDDHRKVASIFNTKLGEMEVKSEREKAITDLVVKVKSRSLNEMSFSDPEVDPLKAVVEQRKQLEELKRIHISL